VGSDAPLGAAAGSERSLAVGDVLMREGEPGDEAFELVAGRVEIVRGPDETRIDVVGPGSMLGEIAALAGGVRTATVRALEPSIVRPVARASYERWMDEDGARWRTLTLTAQERIDRDRLRAMIVELLAVEPAVASEIAASSSWVHLQPGDELFPEGGPPDAAYLLISGRLDVVRAGAHVGEVARGEMVGEVGLIERAPRTAAVVARRESTVARFDVDAFRTLTTRHPALMLQVSRTVLARLGRPRTLGDRARSIAVAVTAPIDPHVVLGPLAAEIARHGTMRLLSAAGVDRALGRSGLVESGHAHTVPALAEFLQEAETSHDYLLLEMDTAATRWTKVASALADRVVVVMSARPDEDEVRRAADVLAAAPNGARIERWLALVHAPATVRPSGSAAVADRLGFDRVAHLREGSRRDAERLARVVSGNATGLVLGGGGARGFAHLGVWRALRELGIEVDVVGGASIGAPMGVMMALQLDPDPLERVVAELFRGLLDYTVPVVSLLKGERIARNIARAVGDVDVRDTWLPFFCVSTNLTRSSVEVHERDAASTAVRASVAIPGVLPPVPFGGDLLVDGGVLNNLPGDVMRATGMVDRLIAVDLSPPVGPRAQDDYGLSVSGWKALRSGRSQFPGIVAVIMRAMVAGSVRDRDRMLATGAVDCYLDLDLGGVGLLDFERVAEVAGRGYAAALPRLRSWRDGTDPSAADGATGAAG